jgi:hypothetical protein
VKTSYTLIAFLAFGLSTQPFAQQKIEHLLGQHPAVIVKRMEAQQGYDYQAKFYPHPAWMYLHAEAPRPMMDHPAVIVARRNAHAATERIAQRDHAETHASIH